MAGRADADSGAYAEQSSLGERISALRARRDMRELRLAQLDGMVADAKQRVLRQPKAQKFLDRLQERCHQKSVGLYEELLSAVVQDVLPGGKSVGLTLRTARGLPSLEIEMVTAGGERESILQGSGGALTNVLSAGLRVIALARSGAYPFLVLDEPDCWLKPTLVPRFASVLGQIAQDLGIQMLIISHHDPEAFAGFSAQVRLERRGGELSARRVGEAPADEWAGSERGIKELRLHDFMSHGETIIPLSPGVTCLTGENDIGKSAIVSGLRALFYGSGTDSAISHGKTQFRFEARFHDDAVVSVERYLKKSPKQRWRYHVPGQSEPVQDSSPKEGAPEWLEHVAKIAKTEDLDIAFANQKSPVFLLDQVPSRQARILAVGRESMHLQRLIAKNKQRNMLDARLITDGEEEGASIKRELAQMSRLDEHADDALALRRSYESWGRQQAVAEGLRRGVGRGVDLAVLMEGSAGLLSMGEPAKPELAAVDWLERAMREVQRLSAFERAGVEGAPPQAPGMMETDALRGWLSRLARARGAAMIAGVEPCAGPAALAETERLSSFITRLGRESRLAQAHWAPSDPARPELAETERLRDLGRRLSRLGKVLTASRALVSQPAAAPALAPLDVWVAKTSALMALSSALSGLPARLEQARRESEALDRSREELFGSVGGKCPTCGSVVHGDAGHGLEGPDAVGMEDTSWAR